VAAFLAVIVFGRFLSAPAAEWSTLWLESRGGAVISIVILTFLAFILLTIHTLARSDAIDLLGRDLLGVSGVFGVLFVFESLILSAAGIAVLAGFLSVSRFPEFVVAAVFGGLAVAFLSALHSYLLVVRFSAVGIMKRQDRDPETVNEYDERWAPN
jgi:hypothetical protein